MESEDGGLEDGEVSQSNFSILFLCRLIVTLQLKPCWFFMVGVKP